MIKRTPLVLCLFVLFTITSGGNCKKSNSPTNRLPPETHEGLNTMGCTVNGSLFIPQEPLLNPQGYYFARYTNLDLRLAWTDQPDCGITSVVIELDSIQLAEGTTYTLGVQPDTTNTRNVNVQWASYGNFPCAALFEIYSTTGQVTGQVAIDYYDSSRGIVSGNFSFDAVDKNSDTVHVREGRFDMSLQPQ